MSLKGVLRQAINRATWYPASLKNRDFQIGRHRIVLPPSHKLDLYASTFPTYNKNISVLSRILTKLRPGYLAIDIGANIGDTAAYICAEDDVPVLCIEGNRQYFSVLEQNCSAIGPHIELEKTYVGTGTEVLDDSLVKDNGGTTSVLKGLMERNPQCSAQVSEACGFKPLSRILDDHPAFWRSKLIKTDTDGYDFKIMRESLDVLTKMKPVLFFEYDPAFSSDRSESLQCMKSLIEAGYNRFMAYDNFGALSHALDDLSDFARMNEYLLSCRANGEGPIFYDICAFHQSDEDLYQAMSNNA